MEKKTLENKQLSRKDFLKGAGVTLAGVAMAGTMGTVLTACSSTTASADPEPYSWPLPYEKVDPAVAEENAFKGYKEKGG